MKRILLALLLLVAVAQSADACNRCGLFGNKCRFVSTGHHVATYTPPSTTTNILFNNSFPVPYLLSQQGTTVYGQAATPSYSLSAQAYQFDAAGWLDRASRFQELALETAQRGNDGFTAGAATAMALTDAINRRQTNAVVALSAITANQPGVEAGVSAQGFSTQSTRVTIRNGELSVENLDPESGEVRAFGTGNACAKCHDGKAGPNKPPKHLDYSRTPLSDELYQKAIDAVMNGRMPPNIEWSVDQKTKSLANLAKQLVK